MNRLVFVNELGPNFRGDNLYEFIFSDNEDVSGEDWEEDYSNFTSINESFIRQMKYKAGIIK